MISIIYKQAIFSILVLEEDNYIGMRATDKNVGTKTY